MFNLEQAINEWRRQMLDAGVKSPVPLEELELHLREEIERQMKSGRSEALAFEFAAQEIGQADAMEDEFMKIDEPKSAPEWRLMEIGFGTGGILFPLWVCASMLYFKYGAWADFSRDQQMSALLAAFLFAAFVWGGRLSAAVLPVIHSKRTRAIITVSCAVPVITWWVVFMNVIVPRHDFTMCQFLVAFLWGFVVPGGLMMGLLWGMEAATRREATNSTAV